MRRDLTVAIEASPWEMVTLTASDVDQILQIEEQSFPRPWSRESYNAELLRSDSYCYGVRVAEAAAAEPIAAYICYRVYSGEMHLLKIAVAPKRRTQGLALWLLARCMENAGKLGAARILLEVRPSNTGAIALYDKLGLRIIGKRPRYYPDTREDALVMAKDLS